MRYAFLVGLVLLYSSNHLEAGGTIEEHYDHAAEALHDIIDGEELIELAAAMEKAGSNPGKVFTAMEKISSFWSQLFLNSQKDNSTTDEAKEIYRREVDYCDLQFTSYCERPSPFQPGWLAQEMRGIGEALVKLKESENQN